MGLVNFWGRLFQIHPQWREGKNIVSQQHYLEGCIFGVSWIGHAWVGAGIKEWSEGHRRPHSWTRCYPGVMGQLRGPRGNLIKSWAHSLLWVLPNRAHCPPLLWGRISFFPRKEPEEEFSFTGRLI